MFAGGDVRLNVPAGKRLYAWSEMLPISPLAPQVSTILVQATRLPERDRPPGAGGWWVQPGRMLLHGAASGKYGVYPRGYGWPVTAVLQIP